MEYISEHVRQEFSKEQKDAAWRLYVAETLRCISESSAKYAGGPYMPVKWADILNPPQEETRTPEEVVEYMKNRLKEVGESGCI